MSRMYDMYNFVVRDSTRYRTRNLWMLCSLTRGNRTLVVGDSLLGTSVGYFLQGSKGLSVCRKELAGVLVRGMARMKYYYQVLYYMKLVFFFLLTSLGSWLLHGMTRMKYYFQVVVVFEVCC